MDQSIERQAVRLYYIQKKQEFLTNIMVDKLLALQNLYDPEGNIPIIHELIFRGINLQYELRHLILSINDYDNYIHKLLVSPLECQLLLLRQPGRVEHMQQVHPFFL